MEEKRMGINFRRQRLKIRFFFFFPCIIQTLMLMILKKEGMGLDTVSEETFETVENIIQVRQEGGRAK